MLSALIEKLFSPENRKALIAVLALALVALTGGVIKLIPNVGDEVEIDVPAPAADDDDSGVAGDDDDSAALPPTPPAPAGPPDGTF